MNKQTKTVNVIVISRDGTETKTQMQLRHLLQARASETPGKYEPGDEECKKLLEQIPASIVPKGTTQKDVAEFEKNKGTIEGKGRSTFDAMLEAASAGKDITIADEEDQGFEVPERESEEAPENFTTGTGAGNVSAKKVDDSVTDEDPIEEIKDEFQAQTKAAEPDEKVTYTKTDLNKFNRDQIEAIVDDLPIADKMKSQLKKIRTKKQLVDEVADITK